MDLYYYVLNLKESSKEAEFIFLESDFMAKYTEMSLPTYDLTTQKQTGLVQVALVTKILLSVYLLERYRKRFILEKTESV